MAVKVKKGDNGMRSEEQVGPMSVTGGEYKVEESLERVSEVLLLFAALFDEPPPEAGIAILREEIFPRLHGMLGLSGDNNGDAGEIDTMSFASEYERLFLLPGPVNPYLSAYHAEERRWDGTAQIAKLMAIMELPWRKTGFTPGKACPFAPDHLAVVFSLLALLIKCEPNEEKICGKRSFEWCDWLAGEIVLALAGLQKTLVDLQPAAPSYLNVARLAHAYLKVCKEVRPWDPDETKNKPDALSIPTGQSSESIAT